MCSSSQVLTLDPGTSTSRVWCHSWLSGMIQGRDGGTQMLPEVALRPRRGMPRFQCAWEGKRWKTNDLRWPENLRGVCFTLVMIYITYWYSYVLCDRISLEKTNRTLDSGCVWSWSWKASTRPDHQCLQESPCTIVHNVKVSYYLFVLKRVHVDPLFPTRTYLSIYLI